MTATLLAQAAYGVAANTVRTPRGSEYAAFETITARLSRAAAPDSPISLRATAVHDNRRLWITLATDLASPDNSLPEGLRAQLLALAEFSILQSRTALRDPAALSALVDINRSIMRGLNGEQVAS